MLSRGRLSVRLDERRRTAEDAVEKIDPEAIRFNPDDVVQRLVEQFSFEPVAIRWHEMRRDRVAETSALVDNFGHAARVRMMRTNQFAPITGDSELLTYQASRSWMGVPSELRSVNVRDNDLEFDVDVALDAQADAVLAKIAAVQKRLDTLAEWANGDVQAETPHLERVVRQKVEARKRQLDSIAALDEALDIPLRASNQPVTLPVARKKVRVSRRASQGGSQRPSEPRISDAIYEDVLATIRSVGNSFERLPSTARRFTEPELRDLLLFILNSNYEGLARGEVFNGKGKTDILIPYGDRNAFIGECKKWRGEKGLKEAVDQLLGYVVWRDTRAALIVFIGQSDATNIIKKARRVLRLNPSCISVKEAADSSMRSDYLFRAPDDPERHIQVALLPVVLGVQNS